MKKILFTFMCISLLIGCKKGKSDSLLDEKDATNSKTVLTILNNHNKNNNDFTTSAIRSSASFESDKESRKFGMDILIEKDKQILINVRFLGFPVAKALVTPEQVQYYEKINGVYFEGDFSVLSKWVGTELDFNRFQNLLLGQAIDNKSFNKKLNSTIEDGLHKLEAAVEEDIQSAFYFEDKSGLLKKEEISETTKNRSVTISYPSYKKVDKFTTPTEINILARQEKTIHLNIRYDNVTFNEDLNFKYKVPSGYKRVGLN